MQFSPVKRRKDMEYWKGKERQSSSSSSDGTERACLSKHAVHPAFAPYSYCTPEVEDHIKVGSFYEIDISKLAPETPEQLKSIRVVMVNDKKQLKISLRFPSLYSLRTHLKDGSDSKPDGKKLPALDEKYVMDSDHAARVLYRRIPSQELAEQRNSWGFWVGRTSMAAEGSSTPSPALNGGVNAVHKKGTCLSELKGSGMVQWGKRRQVRFLRRHEQTILKGSSSDVKGNEEEEREKEDCGVDAGSGEEEMEDGESPDDATDAETAVIESTRETTSKLRNNRKRHGSTMKKKAKKVKLETQQPIQAYQSRKKTLKNSINRWSADRYKLAEKNMLKILKAKEAVFGKPILRPALRAEARKVIGDTGLLDHLLKHMAGKVAPGGVDRFRRRHNADGAMEYWLESANLVNIRKDAGVQDPYWTPPPGWQPGDNPTMDPVCAKELRELKKEMAEMKREMQEIVSKNQGESQAMVAVPPPPKPCENLEDASSILSKLEEMHEELARKKEMIGEEFEKFSQSLIEVEGMMGKLKTTTVEDSSYKVESGMTSQLALANSPGNEKETKGAETEKDKEGRVKAQDGDKAKGTGDGAAGEKEDKAAKIERLRSGFRICKPQGTFRWPDMGMMPPLVSSSCSPHQVVVPTPPSASSSSLILHPFPSSTVSQGQYYVPPQTSPPPVKPLAERRGVPVVTVSCSSALTGPLPDTTTLSSATAMPTSVSPINLNEVPQATDSSTTYYQRLPLLDATNTTTAGGKKHGV